MRLNEWSDTHALIVSWAFYLGLLVVLAGTLGAGASVVLALLPLLVWTGWLVRWVPGLFVLACGGLFLTFLDPALVLFQLDIGIAVLDRATGVYVFGLLFLALGRALRLYRDHRRRADEKEQEADDAHAREAFQVMFLRTAAHEIANPLSPLRVQIAALQLRPGIESDPKLAGALARMDRSALRLERLVGDLRDAALALQGGLDIEPEPTDISALIQDACAEVAPLASGKGLTWSQQIDAGLAAQADGDRLGQAISNLLHNAVKYTPHGAIAVRAWRDDDIFVEVRDTGLGLSEDQRAMLFRPFIRLHEGTKGTGLGLCVARGIARAHGGDIAVRSDGEGKGSTFTLRIDTGGPQPGAQAWLPMVHPPA